MADYPRVVAKADQLAVSNMLQNILRKIQREDRAQDEKSMSGVVYLTDLPSRFKEKEIRKLVKPVGKATSVRLIRNKKTGQCLGCAFAIFDELKMAENVANAINMNELMSSYKIRAEFINPSPMVLKNVAPILKANSTLPIHHRDANPKMRNIVTSLRDVQRVKSRIKRKLRRLEAKLKARGIHNELKDTEAELITDTDKLPLAATSSPSADSDNDSLVPSSLQEKNPPEDVFAWGTVSENFSFSDMMAALDDIDPITSESFLRSPPEIQYISDLSWLGRSEESRRVPPRVVERDWGSLPDRIPEVVYIPLEMPGVYLVSPFGANEE